MKYLIAALFIAVLSTACGTANGNDMHLESLQAADGTFCYVVVQNGQAGGLSCRY